MLHLFVKALLQTVMERSFRERELASLLLVNLSPVPLTPEQVRATDIMPQHLVQPVLLAPHYLHGCSGNSCWHHLTNLLGQVLCHSNAGLH